MRYRWLGCARLTGTGSCFARLARFELGGTSGLSLARGRLAVGSEHHGGRLISTVLGSRFIGLDVQQAMHRYECHPADAIGASPAAWYGSFGASVPIRWRIFCDADCAVLVGEVTASK